MWINKPLIHIRWEKPGYLTKYKLSLGPPPALPRAVLLHNKAFGLMKALELFDFEKQNYHTLYRETKLGDYAMVMGLVMLMFIGFNRI